MNNIFLETAQNYTMMGESEKQAMNNRLRDSLNKVTNQSKTEREKELDRLAKEEFEEYKRKKKEFYDNPIHWTNNKRRRHGLSVLRGSVNKCRSKRYLSYHPSAILFSTLDDIIVDTLSNKMRIDEYFESFVDYKDVAYDNANIFYASE